VWAEAQLPRLIDAACTATLARIPFYRDEKIVPVGELSQSIADNVRALVAAIGDPSASLDSAAAEATGRRRASQGAPLPEVLRCYHICFTTLWDELVQHVGGSPGPEDSAALLTAAGLIFQLTDQHATALSEAYRAATAEMLLARSERRSALVEALLTGQPGPDGVPWEAADLLGMHRDGLFVVVAADTRGLAEPGLPDVERRLSDRGIVSGWRLTSVQQMGVVSLRPDREDRCYDRMLAILRAAARSRTGVSPAYSSVADTPRALRLAQAALAGLPLGMPQVRAFSPSPLAALMVHDSQERRRLTREVLGDVLGLPAKERSILLDTLDAYLDHDGSADRASNVLHCHPNTVRYRLRRLQELTGRSLTDPSGVAELVAAAYGARVESLRPRWLPETGPDADG
jgi:hypothetical protein